MSVREKKVTFIITVKGLKNRLQKSRNLEQELETTNIQ